MPPRSLNAARLASLTLLFSCLLGLSACVMNPVTGQQELSFMGESQELALGARYYPKTTQGSGGLVPGDAPLQRYVNQVGLRLARNSHRPNLPWEFNVVNDSQVNAFALPGGKISITRGLIAKMGSEDELASVLGHEIGHVAARHSAQQYTRGVLVQIFSVGVGAALGGGEAGSLGQQLAGTAGSLVMLSYSRDQERQADELGYYYLVKNRYNPRGAVKVFELFQLLRKREPNAVEQLLSSHPLDSERIQAARQRAARSNRALLGQPFRTARFKQVLARQQERAPAYAAMDQGDKLLAKKQYSRAAQAYRRALSLYDGDGNIHARLAFAYLQMNDPHAARRYGRMGAQRSPGVFLPNHLAGLAEIRAGDPGMALRFLSRADRLLGDHALNKYLLGYCYEKTGNRGRAAQAYRAVSQLDPRGKYGNSARQRLQAMGYRY